MSEDGTTNIRFTKEKQAEFLKKVLEECRNRFLQIELGMPPETFFKTHNCFGTKVKPDKHVSFLGVQLPVRNELEN